MRVKRFIFNMFEVNTYIVWNPQTLQAAIIDPGMLTEENNRAIDDFIRDNNLKPEHLINTHLHLDHTFGNDYISKRYGLRIEAHTGDDQLGKMRMAQARRFGMRIELPPLEIGVELHTGDCISIGDEYLKVYHLPGHSPGSVVLYAPADGFVLTGDVLFRRGIGRTDLAGGNHAQLINGIHEILMPLPDNTIVYPGHGEQTTIGEEKTQNMWLGA